MTKNPYDALVDLAMSFYVKEPCRICGKLIEPKDLNGLVYAGYSKNNKSRSAHKQCWLSNTPKENWAFPEDNGE